MAPSNPGLRTLSLDLGKWDFDKFITTTYINNFMAHLLPTPTP